MDNIGDLFVIGIFKLFVSFSSNTDWTESFLYISPDKKLCLHNKDKNISNKAKVGKKSRKSCS